MNSRDQERLLLGAVFGLMPLLFIFAVLLPSRKRMEARRARMDAISERLKALPVIQPLTVRERGFLSDPYAAWRTRIPLLRTDADRFAHYHFVVSDLQGEWKRQRVPLLGVRASWDVLNGSYSVPGDLGNPDLGLPMRGTASAGQVQGWVLDAQVGGPPERLFQAMDALAGIGPLLEPVGIRWESLPDHTRQSLLLRNLILAP
jgi:hypothetical protein